MLLLTVSLVTTVMRYTKAIQFPSLEIHLNSVRNGKKKSYLLFILSPCMTCPQKKCHDVKKEKKLWLFISFWNGALSMALTKFLMPHNSSLTAWLLLLSSQKYLSPFLIFMNGLKLQFNKIIIFNALVFSLIQVDGEQFLPNRKRS